MSVKKEDKLLNTPYFSIIMATFNCQSSVETAVKSVLQDQTDLIELLIVDGNSTDHTFSKVKEFRDCRISFAISEPDNGIYNAWNKAIANARGEWIIFLGADDLIINSNAFTSLKEQLESMSSQPALVQIPVLISNPYCEESKIWPNSDYITKRISSSDVSLGHFAQPGILHRKTAFERFGYFNEDFKIAGDLEFILRILNKTHSEMPILMCDPITQFNVGGLSTAPRKRFKVALESCIAIKNGGSKVPLKRLKDLAIGIFVSNFSVIAGDDITLRLISSLKRFLHSQNTSIR